MDAAERLAESALHRMSQPLTAMRCLLEFGLSQDEPEVLRDFARRSMDECVRLAAMVHSFRELLVMGVRSHETEEISLKELLELTVASQVPMSARMHVAFAKPKRRSKGEVYVRASRSALMTAMWHLNDALREDVNKAECGCDISEEKVCLYWRLPEDKGQAAWSAELESIDPFAQAEYDHVLGGIPRLSIVRTIAQAMGGDLKCSTQSLELYLERCYPVVATKLSVASHKESTALNAIDPIASNF